MRPNSPPTTTKTSIPRCSSPWWSCSRALGARQSWYAPQRPGPARRACACTGRNGAGRRASASLGAILPNDPPGKGPAVPWKFPSAPCSERLVPETAQRAPSARSGAPSGHSTLRLDVAARGEVVRRPEGAQGLRPALRGGGALSKGGAGRGHHRGAPGSHRVSKQALTRFQWRSDFSKSDKRKARCTGILPERPCLEGASKAVSLVVSRADRPRQCAWTRLHLSRAGNIMSFSFL